MLKYVVAEHAVVGVVQAITERRATVESTRFGHINRTSVKSSVLLMENLFLSARLVFNLLIHLKLMLR